MKSIFTYITMDQLIICLFMILVLVVGMISGKKVKGMKDYAIANREYSTFILSISLLATLFGSGSLIGDTANIYRYGFLYMVTLFCMSLSSLCYAYYLVPKFSKKYYGMLSAADIIKHHYGEKAEIMVSILVLTCASGFVGAQLSGIGHVLQSFMGIDYSLGIIISGAFIIIYSSFGGVRAVTATDILQFAAVVIVMPILVGILLNELLQQDALIFPDIHFEFFNHPKFLKYALYSTIGATPLLWFTAPAIQRFLMTKNPEQIATMYKIDFIFRNIFSIMVIIMAIAALQFLPVDTNSKEIIPELAKKYLPIGVFGLTVVGMLGIIMSTADSWLNTCAIIISNNLVNKMLPNVDKLVICRFITFFIGVSSVIFASMDLPIVDAIVATFGLWASTVSFPIIVALIGYKVTKENFWSCNVFAISSFIYSYYHISLDYLPFICLAFGVLGFFIPNLLRSKNNHLQESIAE